MLYTEIIVARSEK